MPLVGFLAAPAPSKFLLPPICELWDTRRCFLPCAPARGGFCPLALAAGNDFKTATRRDFSSTAGFWLGGFANRRRCHLPAWCPAQEDGWWWWGSLAPCFWGASGRGTGCRGCKGGQMGPGTPPSSFFLLDVPLRCSQALSLVDVWVRVSVP